MRRRFRFESLRRHLPWFHLPLAVLVALLQRTPALRLLSAGSDTVLASRIGEMLRAALTLAGLGALHSRAGATTFNGPDSPVRGTVGTRIDTAFTYSGTPSSPARFEVSGSLPPGLVFIPAASGGSIGSGTPAITGIPTTAGTFTIFVQGFNAEGLTNSVQQEITFIITGGEPTAAPTISTQPQSQTVAVGASVTFTVQASGSPAPTFQWTRNGTAIVGATTSTLSLSNVQTGDAGSYAVQITNSAGNVTSAPATLTVATVPVNTAPVIAAHPVSVTAATGGTAALAVVASGTPAPSFQWRKDGSPLAGATDAILNLRAVTAAQAGAYSVVVSNSGGSTTSNAATLSVASGEGRLANLSVRTSLGSGATLIVGFATNGTKSVLIRGVGPTLGAFGVPGTYSDPRVELYNAASTKIDENEDWNASLTSAFAAVGAFPLTLASKDAAIQSAVSGAHSTHVKGPNSGVVLVELYDSGAGMAVRLVNVSARNFVGTGDNILIAGFVVDGTVGKTLLIRAVGPTLASFGVDGTLADPRLEILNGSAAKVVENDNWSATLAPTAASVGAFPLVTNSRDAAVLVTLPPGAYSAQISGIGGGTGEALVEVYEVP
jgi:hypothetical protein